MHGQAARGDCRRLRVEDDRIAGGCQFRIEDRHFEVMILRRAAEEHAQLLRSPRARRQRAGVGTVVQPRHGPEVEHVDIGERVEIKLLDDRPIVHRVLPGAKEQIRREKAELRLDLRPQRQPAIAARRRFDP